MSSRELRPNSEFDLEKRLEECCERVSRDNNEFYVWEVRRILENFFSMPITCWKNMLSNWKKIAEILSKRKYSLATFNLVSAANKFLQELIKFREFYVYKQIIKDLEDDEVDDSTKACYKKAQKEAGIIIGEFKREFKLRARKTGMKTYHREKKLKDGTKVLFDATISDGKIVSANALWEVEHHTSQIDVVKRDPE